MDETTSSAPETAAEVLNSKMPKRIGDVASREIFPGSTRVEFESLLGAELTISAIKVLKGEYGQYVIIAFTRAGEETLYSTSTGAGAVFDQLVQVQEANAFPVIATVTNDKGYFSFI